MIVPCLRIYAGYMIPAIVTFQRIFYPGAIRMLSKSTRAALLVLSLVTALAAGSTGVLGQAGATNGEWPHWGADSGATKYSPLDQINRDNVKNLRIAWRWKAENFGPRPQTNMEATPLMVGGVLYTTAGIRPNVVAIDGVT